MEKDLTEYKIVYYKDNEMIIEKCIGQVWKDDKYKKYHTRIYPGNYEPSGPGSGYGSEELIDSW